MTTVEDGKFLHWIVDSGFLPIVGFFAVYIFREIYKDKKFDKLREEGQPPYGAPCRFLRPEDMNLEKLECKFSKGDHDRLTALGCSFRSEDHNRLSEALLLAKTNEIFTREINADQLASLRALERISDKIEGLAKDIRNEISRIQIKGD